MSTLIAGENRQEQSKYRRQEGILKQKDANTGKSVNCEELTLIVSGDLRHMLITFANSLGPNQG